MPEEADHGLFAYAAEDLPYDLANQLVTVEPGQATARFAEWYEDSAEVESLSDFHTVAVMLRQCQEIVRQHSPEVVQEQRLEEFACDWMPILAEHQANQRGLANYMGVFVEVVRQFLATLQLMVQDTESAMEGFEQDLGQVLHQAFASAKALSDHASTRLASGVMSTHHPQVQRTHRNSHSVEARQILRYWGKFQWEHKRLLKRSEMQHIQSQTGLTMAQVQTSLSNFRKREKARVVAETAIDNLMLI